MPRFAANLSMMFTEVPLLQRFAAAKQAGFDAVEILFPYDDAPKLIARELLAHDLDLVLINCPPPNYTGGERGLAAVPERKDRFRSDFKRCLKYAEQLKPKFIHIMAGAATGEQARQTFVENLKWAAETAPSQALTIEPINQISQPGYFLSDFDLAADILAEVGANNLGLQYDAYHAQIITGDAVGVWQRHKSLVRHVQVAAVKGRHEPDQSEIDYPALFRLFDQDGYQGHVSGEYKPRGLTVDGLAWIEPSFVKAESKG